MKFGLIISALIIILPGQAVHSQTLPDHFVKEISFITDNDNYTLQKRDGYYTNGFYLSFQHLGTSKKASTEKLIMRYEVGQMIFNPYKYSIVDPEQMDRPFAGYLHAKVTRSRFFYNGANFQYGLSAGILGKASGAEQTQKLYHNLINIYPVEGWGYQLNNEAALNISAQYTQPVLGKLKTHRIIDLHGVAKANLGNTFTNATAGLLLRIGSIERPAQSVYWNSRLHKSQPDYLHQSEAFIFYQPEVMWQGYNATLQGGLFRDDKGPVIAELQPWLYQHRIGFMYAKRRFSFALESIHRTKEAKYMRRKENYGRILLAYRFN